MKVLIVPEDPTLDRHVLKPVVERVLSDLGKTARVYVLTDPHLRGIDQALDSATLTGIIEDNAMIDLFILAVDRDCNRMRNTTRASQRTAEHPDKLIAVLAREEVEVWPLALHRGDLPVGWQEVREECDPKEHFWDPFVKDRGWMGTVGKGRKRAMRALAGNWNGLLRVCSEIDELRDNIRQWLEQREAM